MTKISIEEYEGLINGVSHLHGTILEVLKAYSGEVENLVSKGGGFNDKLVTADLKRIIDSFNSDAVSALANAFEECEEKIKAFGSDIDSCDNERRPEAIWGR